MLRALVGCLLAEPKASLVCSPAADSGLLWRRLMGQKRSAFKEGRAAVQYTVEALATLVNGTVEGNGQTAVYQASPLTHAGPGHITFVEDHRFVRHLLQSSAAAAVVGPKVQFQSPIPLIRVAKPVEAFGLIVDHFRGPSRSTSAGIHPLSCIATTAKLGIDVTVGPYVVIGEDVIIGDRCKLMAGAVIGDGCRLGNEVTLYPRVVLYSDTVLGNRVLVHAGAVLGSDGFGYRTDGGRHVKVLQRGHVEIGDDVEIGANTTVDRATFQTTSIGEGTKVDNQVQIAHNCQIGRHNLIVSQVGLAGSCKTGDHVVIAGQAGVKDHITIGDGAILEAMSGVMENVPAGQKWVGIPATPAREQFRLVGLVHKLPEMRERINALAKRLDDLENGMGPRKRSA